MQHTQAKFTPSITNLLPIIEHILDEVFTINVLIEEFCLDDVVLAVITIFSHEEKVVHWREPVLHEPFYSVLSAYSLSSGTEYKLEALFLEQCDELYDVCLWEVFRDP